MEKKMIMPVAPDHPLKKEKTKQDQNRFEAVPHLIAGFCFNKFLMACNLHEMAAYLFYNPEWSAEEKGDFFGFVYAAIAISAYLLAYKCSKLLFVRYAQPWQRWIIVIFYLVVGVLFPAFVDFEKTVR